MSLSTGSERRSLKKTKAEATESKNRSVLSIEGKTQTRLRPCRNFGKVAASVAGVVKRYRDLTTAPKCRNNQAPAFALFRNYLSNASTLIQSNSAPVFSAPAAKYRLIHFSVDQKSQNIL